MSRLGFDLTQLAHEAAHLRHEAALDARLAISLEAVRQWQARRLAATHADLLRHPRYAGAAHFFLEDLYDSEAARRRDQNLARMIPVMQRVLPAATLETVRDAIEMDLLSERLDHRVALALAADACHELSDAAYARAYRDAGTPDERHHQVELIGALGKSLDKLVRKPVLGRLLHSMRGVARAAGLSPMHEFLVKGYDSFKSMNGASEFLSVISAREQALMLRLFAGASDGLSVQGDGPLA